MKSSLRNFIVSKVFDVATKKIRVPMNPDDKELLLPIHNPNESLESESESRFRLLVGSSRFIVRKEPVDKGVDLSVEIIKSNRCTGFKFYVQLKSTQSITPNQDGTYSYPIETSNIQYLMNQGGRGYYVLYTKESSMFYYLSVERVYTELSNNDKWLTQKTHTVRFSEVLEENSLNEIYSSTLEAGDLQREIKARLFRLAQVNDNSRKIILDPDLNVTDEEEIITQIERFGLMWISKGDWNVILKLDENITRGSKKSPMYLLMIAIALHYQGKRYDALAHLKLAQATHELPKDLASIWKYFDAACRLSVGLINKQEYYKLISGLDAEPSLKLHLDLERAGVKYISSWRTDPEVGYTQYVKDINSIMTNEHANDGLKLQVRAELILWDGYRRNDAFANSITTLNALEEMHGILVDQRIANINYVVQRNTDWFSSVESVLNDAVKAKKYFAYYCAMLNEVKVSYQFQILVENLKVHKSIPDAPFPEKSDRTKTYVKLLARIRESEQFFASVCHIENQLACLATEFELLHWHGDLVEARIIAEKMEDLITMYDLNEHRSKFEALKNGGTAHEQFISIVVKPIVQRREVKKEFDEITSELKAIDQKEQLLTDRSMSDYASIDLFPLGVFAYPKSQKKVAYKILRLTDDAERAIDKFSSTAVPVVNIFNNPIKSEGHANGMEDNKGLESQKNVLRIRKAFFEHGFYRLNTAR